MEGDDDVVKGASAADVAAWMAEQARGQHWLYQETVVWQISQRFGRDFVYQNANGNLAIGKDVLKEFRQLTEDSLVWERGSRAWRPRTERDKPGRRSQD